MRDPVESHDIWRDASASEKEKRVGGRRETW